MKSATQKEIAIIRDLAGQLAEIAALPVQQEKRSLWVASNGLKPKRPVILIDQVCWNEMNVNDELTLQTEHPVCRHYETYMRRILYQFRHMPADMVVEPYLIVPKIMKGFRAGFADWEGNFDFGLRNHEETRVTDSTNEIVGHKYLPQIESEDDLEKIRTPEIAYLPEESEAYLSFVRELFADSIEVRLQGCFPGIKLWDTLTQWCGVENSLMNMAVEPEFTHKLVDRLMTANLAGLDQLEAQGLLGQNQSLVHCTCAYTDELDMTRIRTRASDLWTFNLSQIFASASPDMHREYEGEYTKKWFARFGLGYYGCCEPLHDRIAMIRSIPQVRKVSMSPWARREPGAEALGKDYVFSCKPNPNVFAEDIFDPQKIRRDLEEVVSICAKTGTPLEIIQKDVSTLRYQPERLWQWAQIAAEVVGG